MAGEAPLRGRRDEDGDDGAQLQRGAERVPCNGQGERHLRLDSPENEDERPASEYQGKARLYPALAPVVREFRPSAVGPYHDVECRADAAPVGEKAGEQDREVVGEEDDALGDLHLLESSAELGGLPSLPPPLRARRPPRLSPRAPVVLLAVATVAAHVVCFARLSAGYKLTDAAGRLLYWRLGCNVDGGQ